MKDIKQNLDQEGLRQAQADQIDHDCQAVNVQLEDLQTQVATNLAGWQKALADYQNLQRESDNKIFDLKKLMLTNIIFDLLPIFDNYTTAVSHIPEAEKKSAWAVGLEHILKLWESFLQEQNVEEILAKDQLFDPNVHEAVGQIADKNFLDQQVIEVKQTGYKIQDKIIRPAKVIINNLE